MSSCIIWAMASRSADVTSSMMGFDSLIRCNPATYSLKRAGDVLAHRTVSGIISKEAPLLFCSAHFIRKRTWQLALCWGLCLALVCGASCRSKKDEKTRSLAPDRARHIRVDSGAEPMDQFARLYTLYLPEAPVIADNTRTVGTGAQGRGILRAYVEPHTCIDVLIRASHDEAHDLWVAAFYTDPPEPKDPKVSSTALQNRLLAYEHAHATAWILPHICPDEPGDVYFAFQAPPHERYQIQIHRQRSDGVDRALFEQARRDLVGFGAYGPLQRDVLANNMRRSFPLAVSADHCIAIAAQAEEGLQDLDAQLLSLDGELLALEVATDASSIVGPYCPLHDEILRVEFRAYAGQGGYRWQRWEASKPIGQRWVEARMRSKDGEIPAQVVEDLWRRALSPLDSTMRTGR